MTTQLTTSFEILTYIAIDSPKQYIAPDNSYGSITQTFKPHSVKRISDNEVFTIGDRVSNDMIKGKITEFHLTDDIMFVRTTWSEVGMALDHIHKILTLPSKYQEGDPVKLDFYGTVFVTGWINKVHFAKNTTTYDVEILTQHKGKSHNFRQYNVHSDFVFDRD